MDKRIGVQKTITEETQKDAHDYVQEIMRRNLFEDLVKKLEENIAHRIVLTTKNYKTDPSDPEDFLVRYRGYLQVENLEKRPLRVERCPRCGNKEDISEYCPICNNLAYIIVYDEVMEEVNAYPRDKYEFLKQRENQGVR